MILAYTAKYQDNQVLFRCSDGTQILTSNWLEAITYMIKPCDFGVCWSVDNFAELFCSLIPLSVAKELKDKGKAFLPMPYHQKLYFQSSRQFSITWGYGREINLYPLSRYADEEINDVKGLTGLADRVLDAYRDLGLTPTKLSSPVAVFSEKLDALDYPRACDLPEKALPMLDKCAEVAWIEWRTCYKLGRWGADEVTDYDLVAAYPYLMSKLPDLRKAYFFESDIMPPKYEWGLLEGRLKIDADVTPFQRIGEWEDLITTDQMKMIKWHDWGSFEMKHGWFFELFRNCGQPFKETMEKLYQSRQNNNPMVRRIAKAIAVGVGGKLAQRYDDNRLGDGYNSIYSKIITSRCSCKVAEFIWRNNFQSRTVSVLVDGVLVEGERIKLPDYGKYTPMGIWRANPPTPFIVASLLYAWGGDKHPNNKKYAEMIAEIKAKPKSAVIGGIDLNLLDYDRTFKKLPKCGGDLLMNKYNSEP